MQHELQSNSDSMSMVLCLVLCQLMKCPSQEIRLDELKQQFIGWLLPVET
jgi:hypothetical protein